MLSALARSTLTLTAFGRGYRCTPRASYQARGILAHPGSRSSARPLHSRPRIEPARRIAAPPHGPFHSSRGASTAVSAAMGTFEGVGFKAAKEEVHPRAREVLVYWFSEEGLDGDDPYYLPGDKTKIWFQGGKEIDDDIIAKFGGDLEKLAAGEYDGWRETAYGSVALTILSDQFTRNAYRNTAKMYSLDPFSMTTVKMVHAKPEMVAKLRPIERWWLVLPYMHDETMESQDKCVELAQAIKDDSAAAAEKDEAAKGLAGMYSNTMSYAVDHREVVEQWGRFPHRNDIVGRDSTPEELEFLKTNKGW